jgi:hypothetical protein
MTETSRRALLRAGVLATAAAPLVAPAAAAAATPGRARPWRPTMAVPVYLRSRFAPFLGVVFTVVDPAGRRPMTLADVGDLPPAPPGDERCFTLTFTASAPGPAQGTFLLRRRGFPSTTLFLVPSDADRRTYQAVINNLPPRRRTP